MTLCVQFQQRHLQQLLSLLIRFGAIVLSYKSFFTFDLKKILKQFVEIPEFFLLHEYFSFPECQLIYASLNFFISLLIKINNSFRYYEYFSINNDLQLSTIFLVFCILNGRR